MTLVPSYEEMARARQENFHAMRGLLWQEVEGILREQPATGFVLKYEELLGGSPGSDISSVVQPNPADTETTSGLSASVSAQVPGSP